MTFQKFYATLNATNAEFDEEAFKTAAIELCDTSLEKAELADMIFFVSSVVGKKVTACGVYIDYRVTNGAKYFPWDKLPLKINQNSDKEINTQEFLRLLDNASSNGFIACGEDISDILFGAEKLRRVASQLDGTGYASERIAIELETNSAKTEKLDKQARYYIVNAESNVNDIICALYKENKITRKRYTVINLSEFYYGNEYGDLKRIFEYNKDGAVVITCDAYLSLQTNWNEIIPMLDQVITDFKENVVTIFDFKLNGGLINRFNKTLFR